jgi:MFS transporter, PPP family, 3-phenylpropionic acid transporter
MASRSGDARLRGAFALIGVVVASFIPFFVLLLRDRGLSPDQIGLVLGASSLAGVATTPFWSHAADTSLGTIRTLQISCVAASVAALVLMASGSGLLAVAAVTAVLGAAQGPHTALTDTLALTQLGEERVTEYGDFRLWGSVGWGVACIGFGALFTATGARLALPIYAGGVALYAVYVGRFPRVRPSPSARVGSRLGSVGDALRTVHRLPSFLVGALLVATAAHAAWDFVPLRIVSGGGDALLVGIAAGVSAFVEIPFMRSSRSLVERFGLRRVFTAGAGVYAAASVAWAVLSDPLAVTVVRIGIGVGFGLTYVTLVLMTARLVPERLRNTGQALLQICTWGLAPMIGGAVGGFVYEHVGPSQLFVGSAVGIALGIAVVWAAVGPDPHPVPAGSDVSERRTG